MVIIIDVEELLSMSNKNVRYEFKQGLHIIEIKGKARLVPIIREKEELFSQTVQHAASLAKLTACINACWYSLTNAGYLDTVTGSDPVLSKETKNEGFALLGTGKIYGNSYPALFYIAQKLDYSFAMARGDLSNNLGFYTGMGGLCPLVHQGLVYGNGNRYSKSFKNAKPTGEPLPEHKAYLTQRNDNRYKALSEKPNSTGKAGIGFNSKGHVLIIAQQDGTTGVSFDEFRDMFIKYGYSNACAVDGSDSVFLWYNGGFKFMAAENKNETQTFGIGIRAE